GKRGAFWHLLSRLGFGHLLQKLVEEKRLALLTQELLACEFPQRQIASRDLCLDQPYELLPVRRHPESLEEFELRISVVHWSAVSLRARNPSSRCGCRLGCWRCRGCGGRVAGTTERTTDRALGSGGPNPARFSLPRPPGQK